MQTLKCIHTYIHTYIHIHIHKQIQIHIHIHIHIHKCNCIPAQTYGSLFVQFVFVTYMFAHVCHSAPPSIYVRTYVFMHSLRTDLSLHVCMHSWIDIHRYMHARIVCMYVFWHSMYVYVFLFACRATCACKCVCIYIYIYIYLFIYLDTHTQTGAHTHTHARAHTQEQI